MSKQRLELTWYNKDKALIPTEQGQYGYTWVDPTDPRYCQTHFLDYSETITGAQSEKEEGRTYSERADLPPTDDNLLILGESGDVLETLTRVPELTDKYLGKVKCIYIDPPFNTSQTFANYEDNLEHSVWLTMMRDRLLHLKKLLSDDGSIWVHLDDVENHRMRLLMDEVFGAENFISEFVWEKRKTRENRSTISVSTDHIVAYAKSNTIWPRVRNLLPRNGESGYSNPDNDPRGPWTSVPFTTQFNEAENPRISQRYRLRLPNGDLIDPPPGSVWRYTESRYDELRTDNRLWFGIDGSARPRVKKFLSEVTSGLVPRNIFISDETDNTDVAKREIQALFPGQTPFSTPKPERLLERIIHIATNPGDVVLDVFAGSGTTAAVAQKMGRRWVTCELKEDTFNRFTRPRLEKVVCGEDLGGITLTKGVRVDATETGLPEGLSADDAQKLTSLLNKALRDEPELKKSADVKLIKKLVKTSKSPDSINWRGGGGFTVARLSKACFDVDEDTGMVVLTEGATARNLSAAVAAHLRFRMTPNNPIFPAKREKMNLYVTRQPLTHEFIDELVYYVPDGEAVTVAATSANPDLGRYLHKACPGSRIIHLPDGLFTRTLSTKDEA